LSLLPARFVVVGRFRSFIDGTGGVSKSIDSVADVTSSIPPSLSSSSSAERTIFGFALRVAEKPCIEVIWGWIFEGGTWKGRQLYL